MRFPSSTLEPYIKQTNTLLRNNKVALTKHNRARGAAHLEADDEGDFEFQSLCRVDNTYVHEARNQTSPFIGSDLWSDKGICVVTSGNNVALHDPPKNIDEESLQIIWWQQEQSSIKMTRGKKKQPNFDLGAGGLLPRHADRPSAA